MCRIAHFWLDGNTDADIFLRLAIVAARAGVAGVVAVIAPGRRAARLEILRAVTPE
jgi:hypothetical protein